MNRFGTAWTCSAMLTAGLWLTAPAWSQSIEGKVTARGSLTDLGSFVVSVEDITGTFPVPAAPATMDQKGLRFVPHVLPVLVGATVEFPNSDPLLHNVFSISEAKRFNLGMYGRNTVRRLKFERVGVVQLLCNVHLEMSGFIVVLKNPYYARTAADGTYRIRGVPAGSHRVRCWHERLAAQERTVPVPANGTVRLDFSME